jgi:anti-anti-sigma factor
VPEAYVAEPTPEGLRISGEVDLDVADLLAADLEQALALAHRGRVVVDMTAVRFIDSSAVHAIIRSARSAGDAVLVIRPSWEVFKILSLIGLADAPVASLEIQAAEPPPDA